LWRRATPAAAAPRPPRSRHRAGQPQRAALEEASQLLAAERDVGHEAGVEVHGEGDDLVQRWQLAAATEAPEAL
jgi:hypothetical protein